MAEFSSPKSGSESTQVKLQILAKFEKWRGTITYPTLGKRKSSTQKVPAGMGYVSSHKKINHATLFQQTTNQMQGIGIKSMYDRES